MTAAPSFEERLAERRGRLPGSAETALLRRQAAAAFDSAGFPTRRQERWKYTDLKPLAEHAFELAPDAPAPDALRAVAALLAERALPGNGLRFVFVDGHFAPQLSKTTATPGLELESLAQAWTEFERQLPARKRFDGHPLALLNTAFAQHGAWIRAAGGCRIAEPVHLVFAGGGASGLAPQPRVLIELEREAQLTVVLHYLDAGDPEGWVNAVTEVAQAEGSRLALYRLQEHSARQFHTNLLDATLAADAELTLGGVDLGGRLVRNDVDVALAEPGSRAELFGLFLASEGRHVDNHTRVDHLARETQSDEAFRGIIGRHGRGVFNGKVVVHRDAQRVDARQSSDNLLLAESAEIDTKPELEIYADDVKCSHGATVGELDAEQLFYLRGRGLSEDTARGLLTFAFANAVLERMRFAELRERVAARVAGHLPDQELWRELV